MTRDAKVGLLLGLFFIFVIAFLINGLPYLRQNTNNNELTTKMVRFQNDPPALGAKERKVREVVARYEPSERAGPKREQPVNQLQEVVTSEEPSTRFEMLLPESISVVKDVSAERAAEELTSATRSGKKFSGRAKTYVVEDGDNLASIAKKFYGEEAGNRLKNITRIFEANRKELKSPGEIYVGQKLNIPPLSTAAQQTSESEGVFASRIFEKVKTIGRRHLSSETVATKKDRVYIVQENDSLWKIAAEQLGDGVRYPEISKLNSDILDDEDSLTVGMELRLPGR